MGTRNLSQVEKDIIKRFGKRKKVLKTSLLFIFVCIWELGIAALLLNDLFKIEKVPAPLMNIASFATNFLILFAFFVSTCAVIFAMYMSYKSTECHRNPDSGMPVKERIEFVKKFAGAVHPYPLIIRIISRLVFFTCLASLVLYGWTITAFILTILFLSDLFWLHVGKLGIKEALQSIPLADQIKTLETVDAEVTDGK